MGIGENNNYANIWCFFHIAASQKQKTAIKLIPCTVWNTAANKLLKIVANDPCQQMFIEILVRLLLSSALDSCTLWPLCIGFVRQLYPLTNGLYLSNDYSPKSSVDVPILLIWFRLCVTWIARTKAHLLATCDITMAVGCRLWAPRVCIAFIRCNAGPSGSMVRSSAG